MPFHATIPTQYFRAQMKLYLSRKMLFILLFHWYGIQKQNWNQKAHRASPPKSVILKSQHNILDSARSMLDSSFWLNPNPSTWRRKQGLIEKGFPYGTHWQQINKLSKGQEAKSNLAIIFNSIQTHYSSKSGLRVSLGETELQRHW